MNTRPETTTERLLELIDAMAGQPVLLVADLVADRFITGEPKRISREAPVLILRYTGEVLTPGGGANAAANVASLGGEARVVGVVGDDADGERLINALRSHGVKTDGVAVRAGYRTPTKTRILGGGRHAIKQQIVRYDIEDSYSPGADDDDRLLERVAACSDGVGAAILSDYGYGCVHAGLVAGLRRQLAADCSLIGDSRYRLSEFVGLDGLTPNLEEAEAWYGGSLDQADGWNSDQPEHLVAAARSLLERSRARFLLITRGSAGMTLSTSGSSHHLPVHGTDEVADVTGAGDTVIATLALALAAGGTPLEATCLANYAGGIVVMKTGTATLTAEELRAAVSAEPQLLQRIASSAA